MAPPILGTKEGRYTIDTIRSNTLLYKVEVTSLIKVLPTHRPEEVARKHTETINRNMIAKPGEAGVKNTDQLTSTLGMRVAKPDEAGFNNTSGDAKQHSWMATYSKGKAHLEGNLEMEQTRPEEVVRKQTETITRNMIAKPGEAGFKNTDQLESTLGRRVAKPGERSEEPRLNSSHRT